MLNFISDHRASLTIDTKSDVKSKV